MIGTYYDRSAEQFINVVKVADDIATIVWHVGWTCEFPTKLVLKLINTGEWIRQKEQS